MTKSDWMDLTVLERKKYNCLSEVLDLSQQLGEAMDRNDDVSVRMLVAMRQDPLLQLQVQQAGQVLFYGLLGKFIRFRVLLHEKGGEVILFLKGLGKGGQVRLLLGCSA